MNERVTLPFLVAVETDPLRYHGEHPVRPRPITSAEAERLLAHVAADLAKLFPAVGRHGLCMTGALYDQAQVLRPGWPLFQAMARIAERRWSKAPDGTGLLSIGAADGHLPDDALTPDRSLPPGMLQLVPLQLHGEPESLTRIEDDMEHRFMEEGQLSVHSARALEQAFGIATTHVRFLTLTDLRAMLKLQLEHVGFGALWSLLDAALEDADDTVEARGSRGQAFEWRGDRVVCVFETFDHWARHGAGKDLRPEELAKAYADWTREYRQLLVTLSAHGVPLEQRLPDSDAPLHGLFFAEEGAPAPGKAPAITEHQGEDLGLVAVTVIADGKMSHYYPLAPEGFNALHAHIAGLEVAHRGLSYPGRLCFDPASRRLVADCD